MRFTSRVVVCCLFASLASRLSPAQDRYLSDWPAGRSPQEVGSRLSEHFLAMPHQLERGQPGVTTIHYSEAGTWYGALTFADVTHNAALRDRLIERLNPIMPGGALASEIPMRDHVDDAIFGIVPLEAGMETHTNRYLDFGLTFADHQWAHPDGNGLSQQTRFWIDDMYMLTILQLEAYRATHDRRYLDRGAHEMAAYLDKLQQANGLFYHAPDVPFFWGRGDGWVAAGMTEMLLTLPADHPDRARILRSYRLMMATLLKFQSSDGAWRQLIDRDTSWEESSATAMFTFAMIAGVKHHWLEPALYGPAARRGWLATTGFIDQDANVTGVCEGTGKQNSLDWYLNRQRRTGDFHGFAPVLWSATELLR